MKKFLVSILMIFYLASSIGASIHFHYCSDKLINWDLGNAKKNKCDKCGTEKSAAFQKKGCCTDEYRTLKNGDQRITEASINFIHLFHPRLVSYNELQVYYVYSKLADKTIPSLLLRSQEAIYILNCVFLI